MLENVSIKGTTIRGHIFDDQYQMCPECEEKVLLNNRIRTQLDNSQQWNIDQYLDLELRDFNVELECPICKWQGSMGIKRATIHKRV